MSDEVIVRPAAISDAAEIARLSAQLGYPAASEVLKERLGRALGRSDLLVLVALIGAKVSGWLQAQSAEILESGARVEIVGMIVDQAVRRRGVGRQLVQRAEKWAQDIDVPAVVVRSNVARTESHTFYPALGFRQTKTQHVYRKELKFMNGSAMVRR